MKISPEVAEALSTGKPVVALESTVISHGMCFNSISLSPAVFNCCHSLLVIIFICVRSGMPYPQNLETAKQLEAIVRVNGAIPATIAILDGVPCIGIHSIIFRVFAKCYWILYILSLQYLCCLRYPFHMVL